MPVSDSNFRVVGIGSSSGGYEAIKKFFKYLPTSPGMAFIIIQHITQDYKELSRQLISQLTTMPVVQAEEGAAIEVNKVYMTPVNKILTIEGTRFRLNSKAKHVAISHPIDLLFHALGHEFKDRAAAIILSGRGTDGSRGIRSIAEAGGMVLVQSPTSAQYSSMPDMAISTGYAELVLEPEDMPEKLKNFSYDKEKNAEQEINISSEVADIQNIIELLSNYASVNFNSYKINTLVRRIEKRMAITGKKDAATYFHYLRSNPAEQSTLYKNFLIGVTHFFRDPEVFQALETLIISKLCQGKDTYEQLRIWIPACSTGEEAYTIAILLEDYIQQHKLKVDYKIFATDLDNNALEFASLGRYSEEAVKAIPSHLLEKYFDDDDAFYAISPQIRKKLIFVRHNLLHDPPFIRLDFISCRNLFIYLKTEIQKKIVQVFHYALRPGGFMMLGANEFLDENNTTFDRVYSRHKIYQSKDVEKHRPAFFDPQVSRPHTDFKMATQKKEMSSLGFSDQTEFVPELLLQEYAPTCVVINKEAEVLYLHGNIEQYLKLPRNRMSTSVYSMVDRQLLPIIKNGIRKLLNGDHSILFKDVLLGEVNGEKVFTNINFRTLVNEVTDQKLMLIEFGNVVKDTSKAIQVGELRTEDFSHEYVKDLETELKLTKQELRYISQELEAAREELQASNEEMLSSNEELQSTNEELQSSNEELYSVNTELKRKVEELTVLNNDINNLFQSTDIGIIFLDGQLRIRKFTPSINIHFNIREVDIGRPILELNPNFEDTTFNKKIQRVLYEGQAIEREVKNKNGLYYIMRVIPYQVEHLDSPQTSGIIISFVDITDIRKANNQLKKMARELRSSETNLQSLIDNTPDVIIRYGPELDHLFVSSSVEDIFQIRVSDIQSFDDFEARRLSPEDAQRLKDKLRRVFESQQPDDFYTDFLSDGQKLYIYTKLVPEFKVDGEKEVQSVLAIARDITPLKKAEKKLQDKNEELERINSYLDEFVYAIAHDLRTPVASLRTIITLFNKADGERKEELMVMLDKSIAQLDKTMNGLIDMIDAQAGDNSKCSPCLFQEVVDDIRQELSQMIQHSHAQINTHFEQASGVHYNMSYLSSILRNLLSNAIKYRSPERPLTVEVSTRPAGQGEVLLRIADNGIGIDLEKHGQQLFKPFKRFDENTEGKGIGLHIIRNLVERNGGHIEVESTVGEGTCFNIYLREY